MSNQQHHYVNHAGHDVITQFFPTAHHVGSVVPVTLGDVVRPYRITEDHGNLCYSMVSADAEAHSSPVMRAAALLLQALPDVDNAGDEIAGYARGVIELGAEILYPEMEAKSGRCHFADQLSRYRLT